MEIYVLVDDQPQGPYTPELVRKYLITGQLKPTDLAAYAGSADWKPLGTFVQSWEQEASGSAKGASSSKKTPVLAMVVILVVLLAGGSAFFFRKPPQKVIETAGVTSRKPVAANNVVSENVVTPLDAGLPNTFAEMNAWYVEPPAGQNAATYILKASAALQINPADEASFDLPILGHGQLPAFGSPFPPRVKAKITSVVKANEAAWAALPPGVNLEQARYPIDLNQGWDMFLPHFGQVKKMVLFVQLKTDLYANNKQPQAAANAILLSLAVAQSLKDEPVLISQLVKVAWNGIDMSSLEYALNLTTLPPADLQRLSDAFSKAESQEATGTNFMRAFVYERITLLALFDLPPDKLKEVLDEIAGMTPEGTDVMLHLTINQLMQDMKAQRAFAEETCNHALQLHKEAFPDRLKVDDYFSARADEAKGKQYYICQMMLPTLSQAVKREATGVANLRLAQTAIALEQFRLANRGHYPDTLTELSPTFLPAVPMDPFDGQPLRYEKRGEGYEMHSLGFVPGKPISFEVVKPPNLSI